MSAPRRPPRFQRIGPSLRVPRFTLIRDDRVTATDDRVTVQMPDGTNGK